MGDRQRSEPGQLREEPMIRPTPRPAPGISRRLTAYLFLAATASAAAAPPLRADAEPEDAVRGIVKAFGRHPVVAIGEAHWLRQAGDFYRALVKDPTFQEQVNDIVIEFGTPRHQALLDRYVAGEEVPAADLRRVWRDTTKVFSWESPIYPELLAAVREADRKLPAGRRLRVVAGDTPVDWATLKTHEDWVALGDNNVSFANVIGKEVLDRRRKALVILGSNHLTRSGTRTGAVNTTTMVEEKHPGTMFVVLLFADLGASVVELPATPPQPLVRPAPNVPIGKLQGEQIASKVLNVRRTARVYTPAGHDPNSATPYALLVCFDGPVYTSATRVPTPTILDNLIARGDIPPVVAVFVDQSAARNAELCNNRPFVDFLADELLPDVRRKWHATADPARTVVCGSSAGGLGSAFAAFARPDVFGNVLSQSGAFWPGKDRSDAGREWLTQQFESSSRRELSPGRPVHFVLQVGVMERHPTPANGPSILQTNRHFRDVLNAKGYPLHYSEVAGGHEPLSWRGGIGEGLVQLIGKEAERN
jgi:enterochelin esterase-like enzyme